MGYRSHHIIIKKFIPELSRKGLVCAEIELEGALRAAFPALNLNDWPRPTFNDLLNGGSGIELPPGPARELIVSYGGTRRSLVGAYLLVCIFLERKDHLSVHAYEIDFVKKILSSAEINGTVVIGNTNLDFRSWGVISGRWSDVFSYWLGFSSRLDSFPIAPGEEGRGSVFPVTEFAELSRLANSNNEIVHVSGLSAGRFLRRSFRELSRVMSRSEFDRRFHEAGVRWRPRSLFDWK
ncbi:hypothetical protein ACFJIW_19910 [Tahibacter sp. UC22_41]|uniref:hypothetical protein n=1 Tax=Tahibacter sp. UC22_41 TaxID=3350178 RepID=UPI0036D7F383